MSNHSYRPKAREDGLLVEPMDEELLVFDDERARAHSLNATAARVWRACDGKRDIYALQVECALDEDTLQLALERLRTSRLLDEPEGPSRVSRRVMLRKSAIAGAGIGVALPVIRSITAPSVAMASSTCRSVKEPCGEGVSCCSSLSCGGAVRLKGSCCIPDRQSGCTNVSSCCGASACISGVCT
jgi:hypothetical protein